ncbi:hypothetical protein EDD86DRAFT_230204 [Gorgonomyces haynaldii]|nr:hypothetical protein EDD86DRAFT_230204 [Gorgonomyces haynaldii]
MSSIPVSFWGLTVEPGKKYTQEVDEDFHITMATLAAKLPKGAARSSVTLTVNENTFNLCSLIPGVIENQPLNIRLNEGEEITFINTGNCPIDLTGNHIYVMVDEDEDLDDEEIDSDLEVDPEAFGDVEVDMDEDDEDDDDEEELDEETIERLLKGAKRGSSTIPKSTDPTAKKAKIVEIEDAEEDEEEEEEEEEKPAPKKQEKKQEKKEEKKAEQEGAKKRTLPSGIVIEDSVIGQGPRAKPGKKVSVRYIGRLTNGKVFDSNTKGAPFTFKLGKNEVIKGWDIGVQGMNVGGSRKLTIPPALAYGSRGAPPDIPANATLEFEIKLLEVKQ